jgi:hypothetical protein
MRLGTAIRAVVPGALAMATAAVPACSSGPEEGEDDSRTCGDRSCSISTCETPLRCGADCGTCVGEDCTTASTKGNCNASCASSCDCIADSQFCSADYGIRPGRCLPVDCLQCSSFERCAYEEETSGLCKWLHC